MVSRVNKTGKPYDCPSCRAKESMTEDEEPGYLTCYFCFYVHDEEIEVAAANEQHIRELVVLAKDLLKRMEDLLTEVDERLGDA